MKLIKTILFVYMFIFISNTCLQSQYMPINLKGQILTFNKFINRDVPVRFANIDLLRFDPDENKWILFRSSTTNTHGYYFLYNIAPGLYKVVVKNSKSLTIDVNPAQHKNQFQEIPNIII